MNNINIRINEIKEFIKNHELQKLAQEFLDLNIERNKLNEKEDYHGAFEIECTQRDIVLQMAILILKG